MRVGEKHRQNREAMVLSLLDVPFANLRRRRDQEPPRASWDKGRHAGSGARLLMAVSQARQERV